MSFNFNLLLQSNRLFSILSDKVRDSIHYDENLYDRLVFYTESYARIAGIDNDGAAKTYGEFISNYNKDVKLFLETNKYPIELNKKIDAIDRVKYSVILLLSTLLSPHRFRIMQLIDSNTLKHHKSVLSIGCGPALDIELIRDRADNIMAYDVELDSVAVQLQPKTKFSSDYFNGVSERNFDGIFLIEILEHLEDPFELLQDCKKVINVGGRIYLTTATNIPQFDHVFKFEVDHSDFEAKVVDMGFVILFKEEILHDYLTLDANARNTFYILTYERRLF